MIVIERVRHDRLETELGIQRRRKCRTEIELQFLEITSVNVCVHAKAQII